MESNKKIITRPFIIISIVSVILIAFFVIVIIMERSYILKNGEEFEAKCIDVYKKGSRSSHHKQMTVYVFEVTSPEKIKGEKFEKARKKYDVGRTYKGKYIDNGEKQSIIHSRYEYQIED